MSRAATAASTALGRPIGFDRLPIPRGTLLPLLGISAPLLGGVVVDEGTRVNDHVDYRAAMAGTTLTSLRVEGAVTPFRAPTRMAHIRGLAPLSLREWGVVFGVSHTAIKDWIAEEPDRVKLDRVVGALEEAAGHQPDLGRWLSSPVPGMEVRPVDLLRDDRWPAFRGAIRARSAPMAAVAPDLLMLRRRAQASWAVPESATVAEEA